MAMSLERARRWTRGE